MVTWVKTGTVDVTNGSTTVIGHGTMFVDEFREGDGFVGPDDRLYEVLNLVSNTQMTLGKGYNGITENGRPYAVIPIQGYLQRTADMLRELTLEAGETISSPNVSALAQAIAVANGVLYFTTSTTVGTAPSQAYGRGLLNLADAVALRNAAGLEPSQTYGRGLLNLADAAAGRVALGLGTAATAVLTTSTSDTTAGRVLSVGYHGLGGYAIPVTGANVDSAATTGFYFVTSAGPSLPVQTLGYLLVHAQGAAYCTQVFCTENGAQSWQRSKVNNVWGTWSKQLRVGDFGLGGYGTLVTSDTINTLVSSGIYYCNSASGANLPVSSNGFLFVHAQGSLYCKQVFSHVTDGRSWERFLVNGTWGAWDQLLKRSNMVSGAYDATADRVLTTTNGISGWMGLGGSSIPAVANLDTIAVTSFYTFNDTAVGRPSQFGYGNVVTICRAANEATQIAYSVVSHSSVIRYKLNGTWSAWATEYNSLNVAGAVSASGSTNTGAVIERGTGPNGNWTRYADGTLDMWGVSTVSVPQSTAPIPVNAPVSLPFNFIDTGFITVAQCQPHTTWIGVSGVAFCSAGSTSYFNVQVHNTTGTQLMNIYWRSIGRWRNA